MCVFSLFSHGEGIRLRIRDTHACTVHINVCSMHAVSCRGHQPLHLLAPTQNFSYRPLPTSQVPAGVTWIDLGSSNAKYVNSTFSTLPSGIFNKVAERLIFLDMHTTAQNFTVLGPVEGLFGAPFPNLKRLKMDFDPKSPINGFGPEMFNENLANVSTFQVRIPALYTPSSAIVSLLQSGIHIAHDAHGGLSAKGARACLLL